MKHRPRPDPSLACAVIESQTRSPNFFICDAWKSVPNQEYDWICLYVCLFRVLLFHPFSPFAVRALVQHYIYIWFHCPRDSSREVKWWRQGEEEGKGEGGEQDPARTPPGPCQDPARTPLQVQLPVELSQQKIIRWIGFRTARGIRTRKRPRPPPPSSGM